MNKLLFSFMVVISTCLFAQDPGQQLDTYMNALSQLNRFSGVVLVAKGDTILLHKGYGLANYECDAPNTPKTYFRICSISKMFTAVAILQLQEKGLLKIDDSLNKYILDYPRGNEITIHHLLTHTSGVTPTSIPPEMVYEPTSLESIVSFYKTKSLEFNPGTDFCYSNAGYCILSYIIEKVSGKKFESYIKEYISKLAGIEGNSLDIDDCALLKNRAMGYCFNEKNHIVNGDNSYASNFSGAGGLSFRAFDLYKFARSLFSGSLLNKNSIQSMIKIYHSKQNYGYGCSMENIHGHACIMHTGASSNGFRSNLSVLPDDNVYIVILSNVLSSWVYDAREALAGIVLGKSYAIPSGKKIQVNPKIYVEYAGSYDHPLSANFCISKRENALYTSGAIELIPVGIDQFCQNDAKNILYTFVRNEKGAVCELQIKGGSRYYEIRCSKIT